MSFIHKRNSNNPSSSQSSEFTTISTGSDKIVSDLKALHLRTTHASCRDEQLVESLRDHYDDQVARRHQLERALAQLEHDIEHEQHVVDLESNDDEAQLARLYAEYPTAMRHFHQRVAQNAASKSTCRDRFELKKQEMIGENKQKLEIMRRRYQLEFKRMIDHLEVDSLRLAQMRLDYANT
jgi:hypothetical protein